MAALSYQSSWKIKARRTASYGEALKNESHKHFLPIVVSWGFLKGLLFFSSFIIHCLVILINTAIMILKLFLQLESNLLVALVHVHLCRSAQVIQGVRDAGITLNPI